MSVNSDVYLDIVGVGADPTITVGTNSITVNWNDKDYEITLRQGQNASSGDVARDFFPHIKELFKRAASDQNFKEGKLRLRSESAINLNNYDAETQTVNLVSGQVTNLNGTTRILLPQTEPVAIRDLNTLGNLFQGQQGVSSAYPQNQGIPSAYPQNEGIPAVYPQNPEQAQPAPEYDTKIEDDRLKICEGRPHNRVGVHRDPYHALAEQLRTMPRRGPTDWKLKPVDDIVTQLITEITGAITSKLESTNKQQWINENIADIAESIKKARTSDHQVFSRVLENYNLNRQLASLQTTSENSIDEMFTNKTPDTLSADEKEMLVRVYFEYISDTNTRFVGKTFFKLFEEIHKQPGKDDFFQVVLIEEKDGKSTPTSFPSQGNIKTRRCAFLHVDADGYYSSYNRRRLEQLADGTFKFPSLNIEKQISATPRTTTTPRAVRSRPISTSSVRTIEVNGSGRCLDMSIAYQILRKNYPDASNEDLKNHHDLPLFANELRTLAAQSIRNEPSDGANYNRIFFNELRESILAIPAFAENDNRYIAEQKANSKASVLLILRNNADDKFDDIKEALKKLNVENLTTPEKFLLKEFYADYITQENINSTTEKDKYTNHLDSAFLRVLPKFLPDFKCAIISNNRFIYGKEAQNVVSPSELYSKDKEWILLEYQGGVHYVAVDTRDARTKANIDKMINQSKREELENTITSLLSPSLSPDDFKDRLNKRIRTTQPKLYNAIARLYAEYYKTVEASDELSPLSESDSNDPEEFSPEDHGEFHLKYEAAEQLQTTILTSGYFTKDKILAEMQNTSG